MAGRAQRKPKRGLQPATNLYRHLLHRCTITSSPQRPFAAREAKAKSQGRFGIRGRRRRVRTCVARADAGGDGGPRAARRGHHLLPPPRHDRAHGRRDPRGGQPRRRPPTRSPLGSPWPPLLLTAARLLCSLVVTRSYVAGNCSSLRCCCCLWR